MSSASSRFPPNRQKGNKKKSAAKRQQSAPSPIKSTREPEQKAVEQREPEPVSAVSMLDDEDTDHTRKDESEKPEETLISIRESDEASYRSRERTSESETASPRKAEELPPKEPPPKKDEESESPRKGDDDALAQRDALSPRKGEEEGSPRTEDRTPRKEDEADGKTSEGKDEHSSEGTTAINAAASSSNTTSNNFLALIVSDAEKDDEMKTTEDGERGKHATEETASADATLTRDFNDTQLAAGHSPRLNREGRTRPLSRAGRSGEVKGKSRSHEHSLWPLVWPSVPTLLSENHSSFFALSEFVVNILIPCQKTKEFVLWAVLVELQ